MDDFYDEIDNLESFYATQVEGENPDIDETTKKKRHRKLPENLEKALAIAKQKFIDGSDYDDVIATCTEIIRQEPRQHEAYELLAHVCEVKGDIDKQISALIVAAHCGIQDLQKRDKWDRIIELCRSHDDLQREIYCMHYALLCDKSDLNRIDELYQIYLENNMLSKADSLLILKLKWTKNREEALSLVKSLIGHFSTFSPGIQAKRYIQMQKFLCEVGWADYETTFMMIDRLCDEHVCRYDEAIKIVDMLHSKSADLPPEILASLVTCYIASELKSDMRSFSTKVLYYLQIFVDTTAGREEEYSDLYLTLARDLYYTEFFENCVILLNKIVTRYENILSQGGEVNSTHYSIIVGLLGHSRFRILPSIRDPILLIETRELAIENIKKAAELDSNYNDTSVILRLYLPDHPEKVIEATQKDDIVQDDNYILSLGIAYLLLGDQVNFLRTILLHLEKAGEYYEKQYTNSVDDSVFEEQPVFFSAIRYAGPKATFLLVMLVVETLWHMSSKTDQLGFDLISTEKARQRYLFVASRLMSIFIKSKIFETSQKYTSTTTELPSHIIDLIPKTLFTQRTIAGIDYTMTSRAYARFGELSPENRVFIFKYISLTFACDAGDYMSVREIMKGLVAKRCYNHNLWSAYFEASTKSGSTSNDTKLLERHLKTHPDSVPLNMSRAGYTYSRAGWPQAIIPYQQISLIETDPLPPLLTALTYTGLSRHRVVGNTAQQFLQTLCWLNQYSYAQGLWCPEVSYNYGRVFHSCRLDCLAMAFYRNVLDGTASRTRRPVLAIFNGTDFHSYGIAMPPPSLNGLDVSEDHQWKISKGYNLKREAAHNMCILLDDSGNIELAREIRRKYLSF